LFNPAFGFGGFEFESCNHLQGEAGRDDFGFVAREFLGGVHGSGEGAVGEFVEAGADSFDRVCEEVS